MRTLLLLFLAAWLPDWNTLSRSGEIREFKRQAGAAYQRGNYEDALVYYRHLYDKLNVGEEEIMVNLAHCYFMRKNTKQATALYQIATRSRNQRVRSLAWQQLGVLAYNQKRYAWAATGFMNALRASPQNEDARFNYELARKMQRTTRKSEPPPAEPPAPPPPAPDQPDNTAPQAAESESASEPQTDPYAETGLSQEQADVLLEAVQEAEKRYIQQRKKADRKPPPKGRPDW